MMDKKRLKYLRNRGNDRNRDIRQILIDRDLSMAVVAHAVGLTKDELSRRMMKELKPKQKHIILEAIEQLSE